MLLLLLLRVLWAGSIWTMAEPQSQILISFYRPFSQVSGFLLALFANKPEYKHRTSCLHSLPRSLSINIKFPANLGIRLRQYWILVGCHSWTPTAACVDIPKLHAVPAFLVYPYFPRNRDQVIAKDSELNQDVWFKSFGCLVAKH